MKPISDLTPEQRLKRRYNLCHRLRAKGIEVDVEQHSIQITGEKQLASLGKKARAYIDALVTEYRYVIQTYIPGGEGSTVVQRNGRPATPPLKFLRSCRHPKKDRLYDDFGFEKCAKCEAML